MKITSLVALLAFALTPAFAADPTAPTAAVPAGEMPAVSHWVYLSELPESADLLKDAAANGLTVKRLDRTSDKVVVTYAYPDGTVASLGYALLASAGNGERVAAKPESARSVKVERVVRVEDNDPDVIYVPRRTRIVYHDPFEDFWLPLTLGVGIGWVTGHHGHGGWYGHGHGHGGWHH